MILYSEALYERLAPWLGVFERRSPLRELAIEQQTVGDSSAEVVVIGLGRYGSRLLSQLHDAGIHVLGVDFDPEAVRSLRSADLPVRFGDGEDPDFLDSLPLNQAKWVVSSLPLWESSRALLHALKAVGYAGQVAAVARDPAHRRQLARLSQLSTDSFAKLLILCTRDP
ncbi:MAG: NAD(P)-binding protein [Burkholderiaceae bacterium]